MTDLAYYHLHGLWARNAAQVIAHDLYTPFKSASAYRRVTLGNRPTIRPIHNRNAYPATGLKRQQWLHGVPSYAHTFSLTAQISSLITLSGYFCFFGVANAGSLVLVGDR